jgi:hypothetical protein
MSDDVILNLGADAATEPAFEKRATDPVILPQPYAKPGDFAAQYPQPLDPTEIITMCEEVSLLQAIPDQSTELNAHLWREMTSLEFSSGQSYIAFADGECPEEYEHDGGNLTVSIKNIGAKKTLSVRDIKHSAAVAGANWHGINTLVGGFPSSEGMPGGADLATFQREYVANVKEKEIRTAMTLVMNGWDRLLVNGDTNTNSLEFDGIEYWEANNTCTIRDNDNSASGTFSGLGFDRFLTEGCAKPTTILGHPQAVQEMMSAYFQLGYQGSQIVNHSDGNRITPGYNFSSFVNTAVGQLEVIADNNFARANAGGGAFQASLWPMRFTHNGEPLVYKINQIPLSLNDLVPGCTAVSFQVWAATALVIKACCAQSQFTSLFTGRIVSTCTVIG